MRKPNGYWNFERCKEEALKYENRKEFQKCSGSAYNSSIKNKWLDEICSHMNEIVKPSRYWTFDRCATEASKYDTRSEFQKGSGSAYVTSRKNKWLDEICSHMNETKKANHYWTLEKCAEESLKYNSRKEFKKGSSVAYKISYERGWSDEICSHMRIQGSSHKRFLYVIMNESKIKFYVGITYNLKKRLKEHRKDKRKLKTFGDNFDYYWHSKIPIDCNIVSKMEDRLINYLLKNGMKSLNKIKGGGLGGNNIYWTFERCAEEAMKYNCRTEFKKRGGGAYNASHKNNWLNEVCSHMNRYIYWTFESCKKEAKKYECRGHFKINSGSAYTASRKNKWLDEFFPKTKTPA